MGDVGLHATMADRKQIKLPEEEFEKHNERRESYGLTWAEYVDGEAPELTDAIREAVRGEVQHLPEKTADEIEERLR